MRGWQGRGPLRLPRRRLIAGGGALVPGAVLAACGAPASPDPKAGGGAPAGAPVEIRVQARQGGSGSPEVDYWVKLVGTLNERQGKVRASFEAFPPDKGPAVLAVSGALGDVVRLGGFGGQYPEMAVKGHLRDLGPHLQRDRYDLKQFYPASIETLRLRGRQTALPFSAHPGFCAQYVNLDLLAQAGVPEPDDATWTLTGLEQLGQRLGTSLRGAGGASGERWAMWAPTQLQHVIVATRAHGGEVISRDGTRSLVAEPASAQGIGALADLIVRHRVVAPPGALSGAAVDNFLRGNVAVVWWNMFIQSTLAQQGQGLRWKAFLAPKGPRERGIFMTTDSVAVGAATAHPDQAFEVLKHFTSREANLEWFDLTKTPGARVDFWADRRVQADPASRVFARAMDESAPLHHVANGLGDEHNRVVDQALAAIWSGKASVKDATEAARSAAQEVMDRKVGA
jgi:ABC-type glycerol-3-phosphate transport system substrate-binding protein